MNNDIVIVGAGPAGVATALSLAQRGISCMIIDAAETSLGKTGETLSPATLPLLKALQAGHLLDNPAHLPCYGNYYSWGTDKVEEKHFLFSTGGHGWHLQRDHFEKELLQLALQRGISYKPGCKLVRAIQNNESGQWELYALQNGKEEMITADFVVDATGRSAKIARAAGARRLQYDELTGIAARYNVDTADLPQHTFIQAAENGWWYAAVVSNDTIVTVYMTDAGLIEKRMQQPEGYWELLMKSPLIHSLFPKGYMVKDISLDTRSASTSRLSNVWGKNWIAVGDASYSFDPVSSYGITSALGAGYYAGNAIADHFSGAEEALSSYQYVTENAFAAYLPLWKQQYAREKRWPASAFWKHRLEEMISRKDAMPYFSR